MTGIETHSSIGMISGVSRLDDSAFLFSAWSGLKALNEEFGYNTTILESDEEQDTLMNARYLAHSNFDLMWAVGYGTQEAVEFIAPRFPKIPICTVDMSFDSVPPSVVSVRFDEHHGSFLGVWSRPERARRGRSALSAVCVENSWIDLPRALCRVWNMSEG